MPTSLSNDLRKRIIDAKQKGIPEAQIAADKAGHINIIISILLAL